MFSVRLPVVFLGRPVIGCNDDEAGKGDHVEKQF
jgi:hypothetical protein